MRPHFCKQRAHNRLGVPVHGRGVDHLPSCIEQDLQHLLALIEVRAIDAYIEGLPGSQTNDGKLLFAFGDRTSEHDWSRLRVEMARSPDSAKGRSRQSEGASAGQHGVAACADRILVRVRLPTVKECHVAQCQVDAQSSQPADVDTDIIQGPTEWQCDRERITQHRANCNSGCR